MPFTMSSIATQVSVIGGIIITFATVLFGVPLELIVCLAVLMTCDYCTGVLKGAYKKRLSSYWGVRGIYRKIAMLIGIGAIHWLDVTFGTTNILRDLITNMFIVSEAISVLENMAEMNILVPEKIKRFLDMVKE